VNFVKMGKKHKTDWIFWFAIVLSAIAVAAIVLMALRIFGVI